DVKHFMAANSLLAAQYIAAFASSVADSTVDLFIVLIWTEPSTVKMIVDTFEALAAAANCERVAIKVDSIRSPKHADPDITNEDLYPLFILDAKQCISTNSQQALVIHQRKKRVANV
ncbi:unnamed protein product, partial [Didymodactylos carnosus]